MKKNVVLLFLSITAQFSMASIAVERKAHEYHRIGRYTQVSFDISGPVLRGDTLWRIALSITAGQAITVNQVMVGLFKLNPGAFDQENINCLHEGSLLMIPSRNTFQRLAQFEADNIVKMHDEQWRKGRRSCGQ